MKLTRLTSALAAAGMTSALLVACGGGGGSDTPAPAASVKLEGVAALGRAFAGAAVSVTDGTNTVNAEKPVGADGKYSVNVSSLKAPLIVTATGAVGDNTVTLRSMVAALPADGLVKINISPLTHALASLLESVNGNPLELKPSDVSADKISAKVEVLRAAIANALSSAGLDPASFNPLTDLIEPGTGNGMDRVIETVKVSSGSGGVVLRDALGSDAAVTLTPKTTKEDVSGDKGLPKPADDAPKLPEAITAFVALEDALNKCFASAPVARATLAADGLVQDLIGTCLDLGKAFPDDYLNSSYSSRELYSALIKDEALTAATWRVEIDHFQKGGDGNDYATLVLRHTRIDGVTGSRVDVARRFSAPAAGQPAGWRVSGNRRAFDASVNAFLNRTLYTSAERPLNAQGVQPDELNGNSYYESGIRLFFNPQRHTNVRAVRVTNDKVGGVLPAAGVVLGRADTSVPTGCGRAERMVIDNQTGAVGIGAVGFRSNNAYILDRASVNPAKPISKSAWKAVNDHAVAPITAPVPAYTRYKFEVFYTGNNSTTPDAIFTAPHIASVSLASSGADFKWAEFSADTLAYIKPGAAIDKPVVAWTLPAGALNPISSYGYSRVSNGTARTQPLVSVADPAARSAALDNTTPPAGCAGGAALAELGSSGGGFRGVGVFVSDPRFVRHENAVQWVNYQ